MIEGAVDVKEDVKGDASRTSESSSESSYQLSSPLSQSQPLLTSQSILDSIDWIPASEGRSAPSIPAPVLEPISLEGKTSPREEEVRFYYYGLASRPKLVARSSDFQWQRQFQDEHEVRKVLKNVGHHPVVDWYDDKAIKDIIKALGDLEWNTIDILRIGYECDDPTRYPIILWVSVQPGSTTWDRGYQCALSCKAMLRYHGITDVECEIKEAEVFRLTGPQYLSLGIQDLCSDYCLPFTQTLGQAISCCDQPTYEGSMGLYLKQNDGAKYFGLTCRHCVWSGPNDGGSVNTSLYNICKPKTSQRPLRIIQPGDTTFKSLKEKTESHIRIWSEEKKRQNDNAIASKELQRLKEEKNFLDHFHTHDDRLIGHVFFSPPRNLHPDQWLRDWALIELDIKKVDVNSLTNIVYIDQIPETIRPKLEVDPRVYLQLGANRSLELQQVVVPVVEMKDPTMMSENDEKCLIVGKRGRTSKVTWGTANEVKSVTRLLEGDEQVISNEWCVLSSISTPFSKKGDSGSVVFDLLGRICGILTGGNGLTDTTDITYVTPMEWLLQDINNELEGRFRMTVSIL